MLPWPTDTTARTEVSSLLPHIIANVEPSQLDEPEAPTDDETPKDGSLCQDIITLKLSLRKKTREADFLRRNLFMAGERIGRLRGDIMMAEERARRAKEMTEEAINEAEVAMKANRELTAKVVDLQAGFQALTDEEILREFTTLHHDVVQWSFSHFQSPTTPDGDTLGSSQGGDTLDLIAVRLGLSTSIYNEVLKHHIVGEGSAESAYLRDVDMEVQKQCSTRTAHHWRGATSMVAFSLNRGKMEAMVIDLVNQMEETFGHRSHTASKRRTHQLRGLIWRCIDLKQKLEVQYDTYIFLSTSREMPFDEFRMLSSSEINARNSKVVCSLWPGLVKLSSTGDTFVVEKELVMTDHEECVVWESESTEYAGLL